MYSRFFRWATDRLGDNDGVIAYVSNGSFVEQIAFDGMRKELLKDFTSIYVLDLGGNVRKILSFRAQPTMCLAFR